MTENLPARIERHNKGYNTSTKKYAPFESIYTEKCETGKDAIA
jgi:predicted GIY-YIG superfamily endonuclease